MDRDKLHDELRLRASSRRGEAYVGQAWRARARGCKGVERVDNMEYVATLDGCRYPSDHSRFRKRRKGAALSFAVAGLGHVAISQKYLWYVLEVFEAPQTMYVPTGSLGHTKGHVYSHHFK